MMLGEIDWRGWRYTRDVLRGRIGQFKRLITGEFPCMSGGCDRLATRGTVETLAVAYCDEHMERYLQGRRDFLEGLVPGKWTELTTLPIIEYMWQCPPWAHHPHAGCDYRPLRIGPWVL